VNSKNEIVSEVDRNISNDQNDITLLQQLADMRSELARYRSELADLHHKLDLEPSVQVIPAKEVTRRNSRRQMLKKLTVGTVGLSALTLVAAVNQQAAFAETAGDNAIDAQSGPVGYGGKFTGALAPIQLVPAGAAGIPANNAGRNRGELYVDSNGALYFAVGANSWKRLTASDVAGAPTLLIPPQRFINTLAAAGPIVGTPSQSGAFSAPRTWTLGGITIGAVTIPASAKAVFGTITAFAPGAFATAYTAAGAIGIYPAGSPTGAATLTYNAGQLLISNAFTAGLSATGQLTIDPQSSSTNCLVDIVGYYA